MATFKPGDWVQVTPTPDNGWYFWSPMYDQACGRGGKVIQIELDPGNGEGDLLEIEVDLPSGKERMIFKDRHLILSTRYDAELSEHHRKAAEELHKWERLKREKTDEMLRYIFGREREKKESSYDPNEFILADYPDEEMDWEDPEADEWEDVTTSPMIPLPGMLTPRKSKATVNPFGSPQTPTNSSNSNNSKAHTLPDYSDEELEELLDNMYGSD